MSGRGAGFGFTGYSVFGPAPHPLPTPFRSPNRDSRIPLISPQRRGPWLPQVQPPLSEPPPCSSLAENTRGWGQVGRHLWPGGGGKGLGHSPNLGAGLGHAPGGWSKTRSGVEARTHWSMHNQALTTQAGTEQRTTTELLPPSHTCTPVQTLLLRPGSGNEHSFAGLAASLG